MMNLVARWFARGAPAFTEARTSDAAAIAAVHAASFQRGWGEDEIFRLLIESNVVADRAVKGGRLDRFHSLAPRRRRSRDPFGRDRARLARARAGAAAP